MMSKMISQDKFIGFTPENDITNFKIENAVRLRFGRYYEDIIYMPLCQAMDNLNFDL